MKNNLLQTMVNDLNIKKYPSEENIMFQNRILYSATSEWIRTLILDELNTGEFQEQIKSKKYITNHAQKIINDFLDFFPASRDWFYTEGMRRKNILAASLISSRMLSVGELVELNKVERLTLANQDPLVLSEEFIQYRGLVGLGSGLKKVGLTTIVRNDVKDDMKTIPLNVIAPSSYLSFFVSNNMWKKRDLDERYLEIYQRFSSKARKVNPNQIYLAKQIMVNAEPHYYLVKKEGSTILSIIIPNNLVKIGEHYRLNIGISQLNNPIVVSYSIYNNAVIFDVPIRLPKIEMSIIYSFCWPLRNINDPKFFVVPIEAWPYIKMLFSQLDFQLKEGNNVGKNNK